MKPTHSRILTFIVIFLATLAAAYLVVSHPRYAFYRIAQAIKTGNRPLFSTYVDEDAVIKDWVDTSCAKTRTVMEEAYTATKSPAAKTVTDMMIAELRQKLEKEFRKTLTENIAALRKDIEEAGVPLIGLALLPAEKIRISGRNAEVIVHLPKSEEKVIFTMRRSPQRYWRIVSIQIPSIGARNLVALPSLPPGEIEKQRLEEEQRTIEREEALSRTLVLAEYAQAVRKKIQAAVTSSDQALRGRTITLSLRLTAKGAIKEITSREPDENARTLRAIKNIIKAIKKITPFPPIPAELGEEELEVNVPVSFTAP